MRIGVIGVGSIGSVLAEGFDRLGHDIVINDTDREREREVPFESQPKRWIATNCDLAIFALPTPTTAAGGDASIVADALESFRDSNAVCCLRSTMPPGTTAEIAHSTGLNLVYSPEFLRDRSDVEDFFNPDRIVLAGPAEERQVVRHALDHPRVSCDTIIELSDYLSAEIGKEAHNAYFATKVSFANQLRLICEEEGANVQAVMEIITADHRNTTSHLDPLLGPYGGKCLPKDTRALTLYGDQQGAPVPLLDGVMELNREARARFEDVEITGRWPQVAPSPNQASD